MGFVPLSSSRMAVTRDTALATAYAEESRTGRCQGVETAALLALPLVPLFGVLDVVVFRAQALFFFQMRLATTAVVALVLACLRTSLGRRHPLGLGVLLCLTVGLMIDVMTVFTGREASPYYAGINLVQVAMALLMPWPLSWTLFTCALLVAAYAVLTLATGAISDTRMFINNLAFLGATGVIAVVSARHRESLRVQEFASRSALAEALRHKGDFMAKMSHELRTPLHAIIGYADILTEEGPALDPDEQQALVGRIRSRGRMLHRLISELLDYSKLEAGRMDVRLDPVRVEEIMERVADGFRPLLAGKPVRLQVAAQDDLPLLVTDAHKLEQILTNLVGNAVKFTAAGDVRIEARRLLADDPTLADLVFLDASSLAAVVPQLAILVHDTGIGIRAEDVARLASDFEQVDGTAEQYGGTGLGLSISKRLVQLLGGRLGVRSRYGAGSTFAVLLPCAMSERRAAA